MWTAAAPRLRLPCSSLRESLFRSGIQHPLGRRRSSSIRTSQAKTGEAPLSCKSNEHAEFMSWLMRRGDDGDLSSVHVAMSQYGRGLFASRPISAEDRMLEISRGLIITPDDLPEEVDELLPSTVKDWTKLALFILMERHKGQASTWAPYIECLPVPGELHNTFLWEKEELRYLERSPSHRNTLERLDMITTEFGAVEHAIRVWSYFFGDNVSFEDFKHAYATVFSRALALGPGPTIVMIPMLDFFNHNHDCSTSLSYDGQRDFAVVTSDREYAERDQVWINYGDLSNAELALDYGFTVPDNPYDQAEILMLVPETDPLYHYKQKLMSLYGEKALVMKEVKAGEDAIPPALASFASLVSESSSEEVLKGHHSAEAAAAKAFLIPHIKEQIKQHANAVLALEGECRRSVRKEIARTVLAGELRVLRSASAWLYKTLKAVN